MKKSDVVVLGDDHSQNNNVRFLHKTIAPLKPVRSFVTGRKSRDYFDEQEIEGKLKVKIENRQLKVGSAGKLAQMA